MSNAHTNTQHTSPHGSLGAYMLGFVFSIALTLAAYIPVSLHISSHHQFLSHELLVPFLLILAMAQLFVQLYFFLHLGQEEKPRLNLLFFLNTAAVILIVVVGSVWIMDHLNHNMMPAEMDNYIIKDEGIKPENLKDSDMHMDNMKMTPKDTTNKGMYQ